MRDGDATFTDCVVEPDGSGVSLNGQDGAGAAFSVRLSLDQVGALAMTLPGILERAIRARYRDESLRYVFALGDWKLETTPDSDTLILNLSTPDGFNTSFAVSRDTAGDLAEMLSGESAVAPMPRRH